MCARALSLLFRCAALSRQIIIISSIQCSDMNSPGWSNCQWDVFKERRNMAEHCGASAPISIPLATCTKRRELGTYTVECLATVKNCFVNVTPVVARNLYTKGQERYIDYHVTFSINIARILYRTRCQNIVLTVVDWMSTLYTQPSILSKTQTILKIIPSRFNPSVNA